MPKEPKKLLGNDVSSNSWNYCFCFRKIIMLFQGQSTAWAQERNTGRFQLEQEVDFAVKKLVFAGKCCFW